MEGDGERRWGEEVCSVSSSDRGSFLLANASRKGRPWKQTKPVQNTKVRSVRTRMSQWLPRISGSHEGATRERRRAVGRLVLTRGAVLMMENSTR